MEDIRAKWNSRRGASFVTALMLFLLCAVIGAVILTGVSANLGRTFQRQREQQDYFAVRSAAWLLRDKINGMTFAIREEWVDIYENDEFVKTEHIGPDLLWTPDAVNPLDGLLSVSAKQVFDAKQSQSRELSVSGEGMPEVLATFAMESETSEHPWQITVKLRPEKNPGRYAMTIVIPAAVKVTEEQSWDTKEETDAEGNTVSIRMEGTVKLTTVKWERGTIGKGEA